MDRPNNNNHSHSSNGNCSNYCYYAHATTVNNNNNKKANNINNDFLQCLPTELQFGIQTFLRATDLSALQQVR